VELLQLTLPEISSKKIASLHKSRTTLLHFPYLSKKIASNMTLETCQRFGNKKGLFFEPAGQDLEEFMVSQENLLQLSAIICRDWSKGVEEDDSYVRIYPGSKTIYCCMQGFTF
jgi:hypothetical protein